MGHGCCDRVEMYIRQTMTGYKPSTNGALENVTNLVSVKGSIAIADEMICKSINEREKIAIKFYFKLKFVSKKRRETFV